MHFTAKAVIFDLDGVLADSTAAVDRSWQMWAARHGLEAQRAIAIGHGRTTIEAIRIIAPHLDAEQSFNEMEAFEASQADSVVPVTGAPQFVQRVIELDIPWAVATSGTRRVAVPRLQRAQVPEPPVLITADDSTHGKPHPEPYEKAAAALGIAPWDCVVFEDAPAGVLAARRAGAKVIGIGPSARGNCDVAAIDFLDVSVYRSRLDPFDAIVAIRHSQYRCPCCKCHTLDVCHSAQTCMLCKWNSGDGKYTLSQAQKNVSEYAVMFGPTDERFAPIRHPVLGPNGEYAIDRIALRERAYREFRAFGEGKGDRTHISDRLQALLAAIQSADSLYTPSAL